MNRQKAGRPSDQQPPRKARGAADGKAAAASRRDGLAQREAPRGRAKPAAPAGKKAPLKGGARASKKRGAEMPFEMDYRAVGAPWAREYEDEVFAARPYYDEYDGYGEPPRKASRSKPDYDERLPRKASRSKPDYDDYGEPPRKASRSKPDYDDYDERPPRKAPRSKPDYDDYDERPPRKASRSAPYAGQGARGGPSRPKARRKKKKKAGFVRGLLLTVAAVFLAILIGLAVRTFGFELVRVNGDAMAGTLEEGQVVLVQKGVYFHSAPARGDIVQIKSPDGVIVRRVIALPGESVEIKGGATYVNGEPLEEAYVAVAGEFDMEQVTLASGRYFVMSDNRLNMDDSRTFGADNITRNRVAGKVSHILWPLDHFGPAER